MLKYPYKEAIKQDIRKYIAENAYKADLADLDEYAERLNDELWIDDAVTGNASGSYFFNTWRAEEALAHNWELLAEAMAEFGYDRENIIEKGAEVCDVIIRCYLLGECLAEVMDELKEAKA